MNTLKVGLIGLGGQGRGHAKAMIKEKGNVPYELVAVCDVDPARFGQVAINGNIKDNKSSLGFEDYNCYTSADEMFAKEQLDFVVIAIPTYLHCEMSVKAMRAGCHVLCEKPMATSVAECDEMIRVSKETGKQLMIGQCLRFWDEYKILKSVIDSGELGRVNAGMFYRGGSFPAWSFQNWYAHKELGGGAIFDQHVHDVDMVQYLFGMPEAVSSNGRVLIEGSNFDTVCTNYIYKDGPVAFSHNDWTLSCGFAHGYRVNFEKGTMEMGKELKISRKGIKEAELVEFERTSALTNETVYFAECINGEHANEINPPESSRETIRLVLAEIASAEKCADKVAL